MEDFKLNFGFTEQEWENCLKVLDSLKNDPFQNPDNQKFGTLITKVHKTAKQQRKKKAYSENKEKDLNSLLKSEMAANAINSKATFHDDEYSSDITYTQLNIPKNCYCCNKSYEYVHSFYHRLCPECAEVNYKKRFLEVNLKGRKVILTGGRVKIGFALALKLLRSGADLTLTTRFPALAYSQFKIEKDFHDWKNNLFIYGLDLRNLNAVNQFVDFYKSKNNSLDILINNAAQTIHYPIDYYQPLIKKETRLLSSTSIKCLIENPTPIGNKLKAIQSFDKSILLSPLNRFNQPVDNRLKNSWNSELMDIPAVELLEVNLINHISPYLLIKEFTDLLKTSDYSDKFIINVSSSEGQFSYVNKTRFHPHTNMTKAALNMMTRTSAKSYIQDNIYMNSVDVGWISTGAHESLRKKQFDKGYIPPLDSVDGASRIIHPIFEALINKQYIYGKLLKNYIISDW